jgi:hypothetical protein
MKTEVPRQQLNNYDNETDLKLEIKNKILMRFLKMNHFWESYESHPRVLLAVFGSLEVCRSIIKSLWLYLDRLTEATELGARCQSY